MAKNNLGIQVVNTRGHNEDSIIMTLLPPTWQKDISVMPKEPGFWGENGFRHIHGRQTEFILIGDKKKLPW